MARLAWWLVGLGWPGGGSAGGGRLADLVADLVGGLGLVESDIMDIVD